MKTKMLRLAVLAGVATVLLPSSATAQQILQDHVPKAVARLHLQPIGRLPSTNHMALAIGLPLRNREALTNLLEQLYDPASTNYHRYLTPQQFTEKFGPTGQDYQAVIAFAKTNGLTVTCTYPNRALLDVNGSVADIEKVFHVTMRVYQHPTEARTFYAPDVEPSVDLNVSVLHISGLDNLIVPHPAGHKINPLTHIASGAASAGGSGPDGQYWGWDFRLAYLGPNVELLGSGQEVGLFEFSAYDPSDILQYENDAGIPFTYQAQNPITVTTVPVGGGTTSTDDGECTIDIEMAISMAPGLSKVVVYEGYTDLSGIITINNADDVLNTMANDTDNSVKQFSCSWFFPVDPNADQTFQQFGIQGQSFFQASGDGDAWVGSIYGPADDPYITIVGGTTLLMNGSGTSYASETVWNSGYYTSAGISGPWPLNGDGYWGSGGGVSTTYPIPVWQQGINTTAIGVSTQMRNIPDVAMVADNIEGVYNGATGTYVGTSYAAPLWAGFTALINQQAAANHQPPVGFINPAIYAIGNGASFTSCFNEITGDNIWSGSGNKFHAVDGYNLCTGWGTPNGANLINALLAIPPPIIWTNTSGGNWSDANNWSPNQVPNSSDNVFITASGDYTVMLDTDADVLSLALGGTSGQQTLANDSYNFMVTGNCSVSANGALTGNDGNSFGGSVNLFGGSIGGDPLFEGAVTMIGGSIGGGEFNESVTVTGGSIGGDPLFEGAVTITNASIDGGEYEGTVTITGGSIESDPLFEGVVTMNDASIDGGEYKGPVTMTGGRIIDNPLFEATVTMNGGNIDEGEFEKTVNIYNGSITASTISPLFLSTVNLYGGSIYDGDFEGSVNLDGGHIVGQSSVSATLVWSSGQIDGSATLTVTGNGLVVVLGLDGDDYDVYGAIINGGTVQLVSGNLRVNGYNQAGQIVNMPGALIDVQADVSIDSANNCSNTVAIINQGTLRKSGGSSTTYFNAPFYNTGTLDVQTGTVRLNGGYTLAGGTLNFGINNLTNYGQINISGNAGLTGALSVNLNNGYTPLPGNSFALLNYGSQTGVFTNLKLPPGILWQTNYGSNVFTLAAPPLTITTAEMPQPGQFMLQFTASTNVGYTVFATTNLSLALTNWTVLGPATLLSNNVFQFFDTQTTNNLLRFYQLRSP